MNAQAINVGMLRAHMDASIDPVAEWEAAGARMRARGHEVFVRDTAGDGPVVLMLHGFPTCSFDYRHVLPAVAARARVVLLDFLGYGLSDKPMDHRYSLFDEADIVCDIAVALGLKDVVLVTHDVGDSVGGELCARAIDGDLPFTIARRVITNGSIYMDLVQLSPGQQLLLALPDEVLPEDQALTLELFGPSLSATFAVPPSEEELSAQWQLLARAGGNRLLPKLIRYVEERRVHESRWTGGIENHPSPLSIVWGDADPIAVPAMGRRLASRRSDATFRMLEGIGHYTMIEAPDAFADAISSALV